MLVAVAFAISTVGSFAQELEVNLQHDLDLNTETVSKN